MSVVVSSVFPFAFRPAFRNAVPQIGPDVPPACEANMVPTLIRKVPMSARSIDGSSLSTARKPSQMDFPKSASPISPSKSQKLFVFERNAGHRVQDIFHLREVQAVHFGFQ